MRNTILWLNNRYQFPKIKSLLLFSATFLSILSCSDARGDSLAGGIMRNVPDKVVVKAKMFTLNEVELLQGDYKLAMEHNAKWLLDLQPDRFLAWFRREAGLEPKAQVYGGWESQTIAGHSLGHYMSALAYMYAQTGEKEYKTRCDYIVSELAACQQASGSGYMSAFPNGKKCFEEVAAGNIRSAGFDLNGIWVPWYTQHKLMAGLIDIYDATGSSQALAVLVRHADWINSIVDNLNEEQWQNMLNCEHGGINEVFAELYAITGTTSYLATAEKFYHKAVLDPLTRREDSLSGRHANTQVPKIIGSARLYELTGNEKYGTIADYFWELVVGHYSYANGGNSSDEYFGKPDVLGAKMHDTTETCNTYNMLKLSRHLFALKPQAKYMDYYERALLNHILAHQHPERGGALVYKGFLDMPARKGYSGPDDAFWCCVGTGMENHSKYADTIYSQMGDTVYVNLFISSVLNYKEKNVTIEQDSQLPVSGRSIITFKNENSSALTLKIRWPQWSDKVTILFNGKDIAAIKGDDGYVEIRGEFKKDDKLELNFAMSLRAEVLPDMPGRICIMYGPTLLAAVLHDKQVAPLLIADNIDELLSSLVKSDNNVRFYLADKAQMAGKAGFMPISLEFIPLYAIADEPYTVYMDLINNEKWQQKQQEYAVQIQRQVELDAVTIDFLSLGQMQPERDHELTTQGRSDIGTFNGKNWRDASNGWFEFSMKVIPDKANVLVCTYWGSDRGTRKFDILVDGTKVATQVLDNNKPNSFFDASYEIPTNLTTGKTSVRVRIQSQPGNYAGGLFEARMIKK